MTLNPEEYKELAAIPSNQPFVSHVNYTDNEGRQITLFPAFRSVDNLDQISRMQSPIRMNTVPMDYRQAKDRYENRYHELVREFGPPKDDPENLLVFGRDEVYKSESLGNSELKPDFKTFDKSETVSSNSPPAPLLDSYSWVSPQKRAEEYSKTAGRSQTVPRMRYIYAFPEEFRDWMVRQEYHPVPLSKNNPHNYQESLSTTTRQLSNKKPPQPRDSQKRVQNTRPRPKPAVPKRGISFEGQKKKTPNLPENGQGPLKNGPSKSSMMDELKEKLSRQQSLSTTSKSTLKTVQRKRKEVKGSTEGHTLSHPRTGHYDLSTTNPDDYISVSSLNPKTASLLIPRNHQQISPDTVTSTTNASNFSYVKGADTFRNPDIVQFIKDTPAHIRPLLSRYLSTHFTDPQKELDHTEWSESEVPMKHYWQKVFKVKEGPKSTTIKIENLLSIEPEIGPFHGFFPKDTGSGTYQPLDRYKTSNKKNSEASERRISIDSGTLSAESGFSVSPPQKRSNVSESSPVSSTESDMDLLTVVLKKIRQRKPIDWPELFLLKNDHCRFVVQREKELKRMRKLDPIPSEAKLLERDIVDNYRGYQKALEQVIVGDELYTRLAYLIMRAESYWYAAKVTSDETLKLHFYALARHNYADLLDEARQGLDPEDRSLLTILDKMTQILIESNVNDQELVAKCKKAVFETEKALELKPDVKKERKVIKIKNSLLLLR